MRSLLPLKTAAALALSASFMPAAWGQTLLLSEGDQIPGTPYRVRSDMSLSAHTSGAWCVLVSIEGQDTLGRPFVLGNRDGGLDAEVLARPGLSGSRDMIGFNSYVALPGADYADAFFFNSAGLPTGGLLRDDELLIQRQASISGTGEVWRSFNGISVANNGELTFEAVRAPGGVLSGVGRPFINRGTDYEPLLEAGSLMPGFDYRVLNFEFDPRGVASSGSHWAATANVRAEPYAPGTDYQRAVIVGGEVLEIDGVQILGGNQVPPSFGPTGIWRNFGDAEARAAANGSYAFYMELWGYAGINGWSDVLVRNDVVVLSRLTVIDGQNVNEILDVTLNSIGEYLAFCRTGGSNRKLIHEGREIVRRGAPLDVDGDGVPDAGYSVESVSSEDFVLTDAGIAYYRGQYRSPNQQLRFGVFRQPVALAAERYCDGAPNSTGIAGAMQALGSLDVAANDLTLAAIGLPRNQFGLLLGSRQRDFIPMVGGSDGGLCLGGTIGRFVLPGQIQSSGDAGRIEVSVDVDALPQGGSTVGALPGEVWHFQFWHRDATAAGSNLTQALSVTFS